jgi:hypothetical protein
MSGIKRDGRRPAVITRSGQNPKTSGQILTLFFGLIGTCIRRPQEDR